MNIRPHLKSFLLVLLAVLTVMLVSGYVRSGTQQQRLLHDSQSIEAMLSERETVLP